MGGLVHILQHGGGEAARWIVQAYECPDLAGGESQRAGVDGGEFLPYRGEFDLKVAGSQRLVGSRCTNAKIAERGAHGAQWSSGRDNVDVDGSQVRRCIDQTNLEIARGRG